MPRDGIRQQLYASHPDLMECRRRRGRDASNRMLLGVAGIVLTVLESSEGFSLCIISPNSLQVYRENSGRTSLHLVETEVPCSIITDDPAVLATIFPSFIHNPADNGDDSARYSEVGDSELLPAFFVHPTAMIDAPICDGSSAQEDLTTDVKDRETENVSSNAEALNDANDETPQNKNQSTERSNEDKSGKAERLEQTTKAAILLSRKQGYSTNRNSDTTTKTKTTNVGPRRVGSATKARSNSRSVTRLVDALRTGTSTAATRPASNNDEDTKKKNPSAAYQQVITTHRRSSVFPSPSACRAMIESTVDEMLKSPESSVGLLGESVPAPRVVPRPKPGTVLIKSNRILSTYATNSATSVVDVRVATTIDDLDIANLRLSVFSDFTPQTRKNFCDRSCHLIYTRRQRGAMCIVATEPPKSASLISPQERAPVVGTAEISFHEFADTRLGRARLKNSILYVTELAVNTKFRRKGIARLMMEAVDKVAKIRNAETIYLHVDVTNVGAIRLYENAGFKKLPSNNPVFLEFTTKLNLQDGATKGRKHFLMSKDLKKPTWLDDIFKEEAIQVQTRSGSLGIEVLQ